MYFSLTKYRVLSAPKKPKRLFLFLEWDQNILNSKLLENSEKLIKNI